MSSIINSWRGVQESCAYTPFGDLMLLVFIIKNLGLIINSETFTELPCAKIKVQVIMEHKSRRHKFSQESKIF